MKSETVKLVISSFLLLILIVSMPGYAYKQAAAKNNAVNFTQQAKQNISDTAITSNIKIKFSKDPLLRHALIEVSTTKGNVFLAGIVNTDMQYERAVALAQATKGVGQVQVSDLHVKQSKAPLSDLYITAKVKGTLLKEKALGRNIKYWPVKIETKDSVVYLTGHVNSSQQKQRIGKIVKSVSGVKSVKNTIKIKP